MYNQFKYEIIYILYVLVQLIITYMNLTYLVIIFEHQSFEKSLSYDLRMKKNIDFYENSEF